MVNESHLISDMDDVIIETIPPYDLEDETEVPNAVGEEEIISSKTTRRRIKTEQIEGDSEHSLIDAVKLAKNDDFSKFVIRGKSDGNKEKYRCLFCTKVFSYVSRLKLHLRVHTGEKPYACSICDFTASYKKSVEVHMRSHTGEKPYACSICDFRAARKANVDDHMRVHTGEKPFACPLCDFRSAQQSAVTCHLRRHTGEKKYVCTICNFRTAYKHILDAHHRVHTGERPFSCGICDYKGSTKLNVRLHMRRHTGEKPYACTMCDFRSTKRYSVKQHMRRHTGERPFKCTECSYSAAQKFCLVKHMAKHSSSIWYDCSTCDFKTYNLKRLGAHIKKHVITEESPCPECGITFINNLLLKEHRENAHSYLDQQTIQDICIDISEYEELNVYEGDLKEPQTETYICNVCAFVTNSKNNLEAHVRLHDLLHSCKFCDVKFPNPQTMHDHLLTNHRGSKKRMYVCPFCTSLFEERSNIYLHLKESHTLQEAASLSSNEEQDEDAITDEQTIAVKMEPIIKEEIFCDDVSMLYKDDIMFDIGGDKHNEPPHTDMLELDDFDDMTTANFVRNVVFRSDDGTIMTTRRVVVGPSVWNPTEV